MGAGAWAVDDKGYAYLCCTNRAALGELKRISALKEEKLIGIISIGDVLKEIIAAQETYIKDLENYIDGRGYGQ